MPANFVSLSLALLVALACGVAIYYWRRATSLYQLLMEGAGRFEDLRQRAAQLEQALIKTEERYKQQREITLNLEKGIDDARDKAAELTRKLEANEQAKALSIEKLELVKNHLERQLDKAEKRLEVSESQREQFQADLTTARCALGEAQEKLAKGDVEKERSYRERLRHELEALRQESQLRERELMLKLRDLEKEHAKVGRKLEQADPAEMRRVKRKNVQYERLYQSMKGLREMTDERNRNWEVALHKLSAWILSETGVRAENKASTGSMVGQALAAIGEQLIDDADVRMNALGRSDFEGEGASSFAHEAATGPFAGASQLGSKEMTDLRPAHGEGQAHADAHDMTLSDLELAAEQAALDRETASMREKDQARFISPSAPRFGGVEHGKAAAEGKDKLDDGRRDAGDQKPAQPDL